LSIILFPYELIIWIITYYYSDSRERERRE